MARAAALALLLVPACAAAAHAQRGADRFRLPSGNIYCAYEHYSFSPKKLRCEIRTKIKPTPPSGCADGYIMRQTGAARPFCASDTIYDRNALVLAYGTTRQFGVFKCTSSAAGLKCFNASGNGFVMSTRHSYTLREAAPRYGAFKTPSGNIVCGYSIAPDGTASTECGIKSGLKPPPRPIHCDAGDPNDKRSRYATPAAPRRSSAPAIRGRCSRRSTPPPRCSHTGRPSASAGSAARLPRPRA